MLPATIETVTIDGPGMDDLTIDGDGNRVFWLHMSAGSSIQNKDGGVLTIRDSIITDNTGTVVLSDHGNTPNTTTVDTDYQNRTYISNTSVTGNSGGCAVWTARFVQVTDSTFTDNEGNALCIGGLNRSYVSRTVIARNGGNGVDVSGTIYETDPVNLLDNTIGIPRPPTSVAGTPGETEVALRWTAPSSDSGSPVTGYTATANPGASDDGEARADDGRADDGRADHTGRPIGPGHRCAADGTGRPGTCASRPDGHRDRPGVPAR